MRGGGFEGIWLSLMRISCNLGWFFVRCFVMGIGIQMQNAKLLIFVLTIV